jgi:elongation factor 3
MEQICTDVIHYEKREGWIHRKLVHYRGTMSDFVKKQPQAKHYFELATSDDLVFKFPEPGRLEGKLHTFNNTQCTEVDFSRFIQS